MRRSRARRIETDFTINKRRRCPLALLQNDSDGAKINWTDAFPPDVEKLIAEVGKDF
jgi:hypothetical protein